jgi:membrane-associated protease RseP (regulator of RpoE activity)
MIVAIPVLLIGLKTSPVLPTPTYPMGVFLSHSLIAGQEGNSILYALAKLIVFGRFLPNGHYDVFINQFVFAGWAGLLVTSLNLIPVGQLDGGHVLYSLFGERAKLVYYPALFIVGILSVFYEGWLMWFFLLLVLGRVYATPLDNITRLDRRRQWIAILALVVFVLVFMPIPWLDAPFMGLIR